MTGDGSGVTGDESTVRRWFGDLVDLEEAERSARLRELEQREGPERGAALRARLEALLAADRTIDDRLAPYEEAAARLLLDVTSPGGLPAGSGPDPLGLVGTTMGRYRIGPVLGAGGMGVVYRATDTYLDRPVALKFLTPTLGLDPSAKRRLLREARTAASLDHPNVCSIYEVDEMGDGRLYIAMASYDGETLRERLDRGGIEVAEAVELVIQSARGLAAAHARGLVHRDVKPDNLFLTRDSTVVVLDFGIARAAAGEEALTGPGQRPGTAAYMAPEQARGDVAGPAADVFGLGVVLHEMLCGRRPVAGDGARGPSADSFPGVPPALAGLLARMLATDPRARPTAAEVARLDFADLAAGSPGAAPSRATTPSPEATRSVAVLPFADLSPSGDQAYFCEGMAEELLDALARIDGLRVASRLSSFQVEELTSDPSSIGRRLGVDTLISGSVRRSGRRIRVTSRLVRVSDGTVLWSERYDRELEDVFTIQEEIAGSIVATLRPRVATLPVRPLLASRTDRIEAYDYYLRGRHSFLRDTRRDLEIAREMFARAIAADPTYARAHAGLADACSLLYKHFDRDGALIREAARASGRAIDLDPASADAHTSRAVVAWLTGRMDEAEAEFSEAIRLDPTYFEARYLFGQCFLTRGLSELALEQLEAAWERRPDDFQSPILIATMHRELGRLDEARVHFQRGLELADEHLQIDPEHVRARYLGAFCLVELGREEDAIARVRRAIELAPDDSMTLYNAAGVHALAGRIEPALDYLEAAVDAGFAYRPDLENDSDFAAIRPHPRFQSLLTRLDPN